MTQKYRLATGGLIDRRVTVPFTFDGKAMTGHAGDTLASALLANGVHLVGRSFKYHRPRGIVSAGAEEPNALVGVGRDEGHYTPNLRATQVELYHGLRAESQNRTPSLERDVGSITDRLWRFFPAGFYYKTFMWPKGAWTKFFEPRIRAIAGLGRSPAAPDAARYAQIYAHCDVLVIGAGPAGLSAALAAAETGARVIICDEQPQFGGALLAEPGQSAWLAEQRARLAGFANITMLPRTIAFGYFPHNMIGLAQDLTDHQGETSDDAPRGRLWQVRAKQVITATGAIERPLVFPDNDRPGIMLADAARTYVERYAVKPGNRAVVFTAHDDAYRAAVSLHEAGVTIAAIVDLRESPEGPGLEAARAAGLPIRTHSTIIGTEGNLRVAAVSVATIGEANAERIACDLVLMSGGFTPSVHLFSQSRGKLAFDPALDAFIPGTPAEPTIAAGAASGCQSLEAAIASGRAAGLSATGQAVAAPVAETVAAGFLGEVPHGRDPASVRAFVDFQNDVTAKDITLALSEGFRSIEHVKRYTTTGMATDQGKTSNMNALGIVSKSLGVAIPSIGTTTFRMPYTPIPFGYFAGYARGDLFEPVRETPIHAWAAEHGAVFEDVSLWKRARYFPCGAETMHEAVARECAAVRAGVGLFDASTLGKIEITGPDAAEFLNRMYVNAWTKLKPGRLRYGLLLREDGFIIDDGVVGRIADDRFHVTTTTGGAARVLNMMEDYLQTEFTDLKVWLTSTTEQYAVIAVQGPRAREVIAPLVEDADISAAAMPHMSVVECRVAGVPARLFRVSFTGELGFEINVPADYGRAVWEAIDQAGQTHGIVPYGTETMHVLRAEKGYIIVGQETDGTATPDDVGLTWAIGKAKPDFVGKRALARTALASQTDRKQLVGLLTADPAEVLEEGAHLVADPAQPIPMTMLGHVTSSYWSAALNRSIALAMVRNGRARIGETLHVPLPGRSVAVTLTDPVFYDPEGARLDG
ncbi:MAG: sarcosine oxidase subunit alpha [Acidiphilium sp. 37-64-53]|uniref:sarcosine oxidase subunit alpha family protein n=1 Tax=Acidiphilium TaxID=522 RepID=UPI000BCF17EB|nr:MULTISPECIES: sarcosine oxidase subunit alpha family protein [Acidiphilium]OYW00561.1 MAG: sarcosine oxidase subunit alpha [Acidiphilium sp. 37-64-53]OZB23700.1 MAG: sarcosine oxidase subunit alpha [Acidiphilium sp. 34-64-41]HQT86032.1 sarcosine oxidase subunit alpha family protein [Acidiphilium rubrum]